MSGDGSQVLRPRPEQWNKPGRESVIGTLDDVRADIEAGSIAPTRVLVVAVETERGPDNPEGFRVAFYNGGMIGAEALGALEISKGIVLAEIGIVGEPEG